MAIRDLNLERGTVTRDAARHVGIGSEEWLTPANANDDDTGTKATIVAGIFAFEEYLKSDLGDTFRVTSMDVYSPTGAPLITDIQYWDGDSWESIPHTYSSPTFTFTSPIEARMFALQASATGGHSSHETHTWTIMGEETTSAVNADFVGVPTQGVNPLSVQFTDMSTGSITSWSWVFGDGATSTEEHPLHIYTRPGIYTVTLTVEGAGGDEDSVTKTEYVIVLASPVLPLLRDRTLLSIRASYNDENLYNHALVIATGNKASIKYAEVLDEDPESPTNINAIGDRVFVLETDQITTQATANKAALKAFLDNCLISEDIALEAICNPALEGNDVVGVKESKFSQIERNFRLQSFTIPLSSSRQALKLARIIDLLTQTVSVNDDIVLVSYSQTIKSTAATSASVVLPDDVEDGDLLLLWAALDETYPLPDTATTMSAAWVNVPGSSHWKYKIAESEAGPYNVFWTGSRRGIITLLAYRNVDQSAPIARLSVDNDTGTILTVPGLSLPSAEYHLVSGAQGDGVTAHEYPDSWTEITHEDTGGSGTAHVSITIADKPRIGANPPSFTITAPDNIYNTLYNIALRKDIS